MNNEIYIGLGTERVIPFYEEAKTMIAFTHDNDSKEICYEIPLGYRNYHIRIGERTIEINKDDYDYLFSNPNKIKTFVEEYDKKISDEQ